MSDPTERIHVAVVEDNDTLRDLLVSYLQRPDRQVYAADSGQQLNELLGRERLDVIVLDLSLPHEDGLEIASRIRRSHPGIKIVMLTARVRGTDRIAGYDAGADVYLTKPTNIAELDAVIRNLATRIGHASPQKRFSLDRHSRVLTTPQQRSVVLSSTECMLIEQLALAPAEGIDVGNLIEGLRAMGNQQLSRENLAVSVSRLRQKLEMEAEVVDFILTVRNFGYRMSQPVTIA